MNDKITSILSITPVLRIELIKLTKEIGAQAAEQKFIEKYGGLFDGPVAPLPPSSISMRQCRLILNQMGLLEKVETFFNQLPEPDRTAALIEWEYATEVKRDSALFQRLTNEFNIPHNTIDQAFIDASKL